MRNVVLLALTDPERKQELAEGLESQGFHCLTASDGPEALAVASQYSPQLAIVQSELPEIQGTDVCLRLKQDRQTEAMAVVLVARDASVEERFVGEEVGADAYLIEPLDIAAVLAKVSEMFLTMQLNAKNILKPR